MAKVKIYQYAKEKGIPSKEIVEKLKAAGFDSVKNQMSQVDESVLLNVIEGKDVPIVVEKTVKKIKKAEPRIIVTKKEGDVKKVTPKSKIEKETTTTIAPAKKGQIKETSTKTRTLKDTSIKDGPIKETTSKPTHVKKENNQSKPIDKKTEALSPTTSKAKVKRGKPDAKKVFVKNKKAPVVVEEVVKTKTELRKERRDQREKEIKQNAPIAYWHDDLTVGELSRELDIPSSDIVMKLMNLGIMATVNQHIDMDMLEILALEYNLEVQQKEIHVEYDLDTMILEEIEKVDKKDYISRPPVIAIMGHVDHGKTTLLDTIRKSNIAAKEAGGITQHIGAYQIEYKKKLITFLDTPGHEAFSSMRARGAKITDIVVIVVAADDGIMPQTIEAIAHAKESKSKIIVVVNKMDKEKANAEKIMTAMGEYDIQAEEWGGDVPFIKISALKGEGIDDLLDYINLLAEVEDYKTPKVENAFGTVIESHIDVGRGAVATTLIVAGELRIKDSIVIGSAWGSIRSMEDNLKKSFKVATASQAIQITGLKKVPATGEKFLSFGKDIKTTQIIGEKLTEIQAHKDRKNTQIIDLDKLKEMIENESITEVPIIIKADVHGSQEALAQALERIEVDGVRARVILKNVGSINESDINLAIGAKAIIIGFNVRPDSNARKLVEKEKIDIIQETVIYKIIEIIEDAMKGMREVKFNENILGRGTIIEVFKISDSGKIAGVMVDEGKIKKDAKVRLLRDNVLIYDSEISTLKRYKNDVNQVIIGEDCGIKLKNFEDYKKGDQLEIYELIAEELD